VEDRNAAPLGSILTTNASMTPARAFEYAFWETGKSGEEVTPTAQTAPLGSTARAVARSSALPPK
jgi:hypothetical protein